MSDWHSTTLQEIISTIESGSRPKGGVRIGDNSEGVPSYGGENISMNGGMLYDSVRMVPTNFATEMRRGVLSDKDVLINKDGANTGKSAIYRKPAGEEFATINEHLFLLRCNKGIAEQEFLYHFLNSEFGKSQIARVITGSAQPGLNSTFPEFVRIDLPPLREQKKIAEILSGIDKIIAKLIGKGAKQILATENALSTFLGEKTTGTLGIEDMGYEVIDGDRGTEYPKESDFSSNGYCLFLSAKNVTKGGFAFGQCQFIAKEKDDAMRNGRLSLGDLVITTRGTLGNIAHAEGAMPANSIRINSGMAIIRATGGRDIEKERFILSCLRSEFIQSQIATASFGTAQNQLTLGIIRKLRFPYLAKEEQRIFVAFCSEQSKYKAQSREIIGKYQRLKSALSADLLSGRKRVSI